MKAGSQLRRESIETLENAHELFKNSKPNFQEREILCARGFICEQRFKPNSSSSSDGPGGSGGGPGSGQGGGLGGGLGGNPGSGSKGPGGRKG